MFLSTMDVLPQVRVAFRELRQEACLCSGLRKGVLDLQEGRLRSWGAATDLPVEAVIILVAQVEGAREGSSTGSLGS